MQALGSVGLRVANLTYDAKKRNVQAQGKLGGLLGDVGSGPLGLDPTYGLDKPRPRWPLIDMPEGLGKTLQEFEAPLQCPDYKLRRNEDGLAGSVCSGLECSRLGLPGARSAVLDTFRRKGNLADYLQTLGPARWALIQPTDRICTGRGGRSSTCRPGTHRKPSRWTGSSMKAGRRHESRNGEVE